MGADIENRLLAQANCASPPEDELLREAAAEIGRLRGEVENITAEAIEWRDKLQASTPAPAMPNGVEVEGFALNLAVADDALRKVVEICPVTPPEVASLRAVIVGARALLRAADNRDAAGVDRPAYPEGEVVGACVCGSWPGSKCLRCEWIPTPAAVPAGEAVAVYEGNPCVECGEDTGTGHFPGCCLGTTPQPAEAKGEGELPTTDAEVEADNAKAANAACLLAIASGYAWNGKEWRQVRTPQPADGGEAVKGVVCGYQPGMSKVYVRVEAGALPEWLEIGTPVTVSTTPPAAQVQGEAYQPIRFGGIRRPSDEALAAAFWEHRQRENSVPADLCDPKLVKFGNDVVQRARELAPHLAAHPSACELGAVRERVAKMIYEQWTERVGYVPWVDGGNSIMQDGARSLADAALQHRGDSQEVGRG